MRAPPDLSGQTFGRLIALEHAGKDRGGSTLWLCRCACGEQVTARGANLVGGMTRSCGCLRAEAARERAVERNGRGKLMADRARTTSLVGILDMVVDTNPD